MIDVEEERLRKTFIGNSDEVNHFMEAHGSTTLSSGVSLAELIKRPELDYESLEPLDPKRPELPYGVREEVGIEIKYEGYIRRQEQQVEGFRRMENKRIPKDIHYEEVGNLRIEARQKLERIRPENIGMAQCFRLLLRSASRISGVNPADISVLLIYLETYHASKKGANT